jgi:hypothetical protein
MAQIPLAPTARGIRYNPRGAAQSGFRGFRVDVSQAGMTAAGSAPQIDVRSAVAAEASKGALGEAVAQVGGMVTRLAAEQMELKNQEAVSGAELVMLEEGNKLALDFAKEDDETKWGSMLEERARTLRASLLDDRKLSPRARAEIEGRLERWRIGRQGEVALASFQRSKQKATENYEVLASRALEVGDYQEYQGTVKKMLDAKLIGEKGAESMLGRGRDAMRKDVDLAADTLIMRGQPDQAREVLEGSSNLYPPKELENKLATVEERAIKAKNYNDLLVMANDDPASAASLAIDEERRGKIDATMRVDVERKAQSVLAFNRRSGAAEYAERIETPGMMPSEAEITMDSRLNDYDREQLRKKIKGEKFDQPAEFEKALSKVMGFSPANFENEQDAITAATNMEASIDATFSGAYAARLKEELGNRQKGPGPTSATDLGPAMATLDQAIEEGGLGPIWKPVLDSAGKPVVEVDKTTPRLSPTREWDNWFTGGEGSITGFEVEEGDPVSRPKMEPDPVAEAKARAIQKEIRETIEAEVKAGKLDNQGAITSRALDLFKLKGGKLKPKPAAPTITPPDENGLPTSGGVPLGPNPLLPDIESFIDSYGN